MGTSELNHIVDAILEEYMREKDSKHTHCIIYCTSWDMVSCALTQMCVHTL